MNITNFIVEVLKSGKTVTIDGIGTFGSQQISAHLDQEKGVLYPARRGVVFNNTQTQGSSMIIDAIAQHDFVSVETAQSMWTNYLQALNEKLERTSSHTFAGLGTIVKCADGYAFTADPGLDLDGGQSAPIRDVKRYDSNPDASDVFDSMSQNMSPVSEEELLPVDESSKTPEPVFVDSDAKATESIVTNNLEEHPEVERDAAAQEAALKAAQEAAEKAAREAAMRAEQEASEQQAKADQPSSNDAEVLDALNSMPSSGNGGDMVSNDSKESKKRRGGLWTILIILLLLLGACAYFYFGYMPNHGGNVTSAIESLKQDIAGVRGSGSEMARPIDDDATVDEQGKPAQSDVIKPEPQAMMGSLNLDEYALPLTYSANLIGYDDKDINADVRVVRNHLTQYINTFLSSRRYTNARVPMMDRVSEYAQNRFAQLYSPDQFYWDRVIKMGDDYLHNYLYDHLKKRCESKTIVQVQTELMDVMRLDSILDAMIEELGLSPDAAVAPATRPVVTRPKTKPAEPVAQFLKESKQGYDIVAGFYTNRTSANRMAYSLKRQGCDAYVIDKNGLYYVSMGSAPTQTAAESLFKHLKSWYDGDIAIRKL